MSSLYEIDFAAWIDETAQLLKSGQFEQIDLAALIDEVETLGRSERHAISSHLYQLLLHLLKLTYAPSVDLERAARGWKSNVHNARVALEERLQDSPSLASYPLEVMARQYDKARKEVIISLDMELDDFPSECPWTIDQILDEDFFG